MDNLSFEEALFRLEEISKKLESGETPLEESIKLFEDGIKLTRVCEKKLSSAKQKIISLEQAQEEQNA